MSYEIWEKKPTRKAPNLIATFEREGDAKQYVQMMKKEGRDVRLARWYNGK